MNGYTGWAIPEGNVVEVADAIGRVIWSAVKPCTVTIKSRIGAYPTVANPLDYVYVTIDGQTYKAKEFDTVYNASTQPSTKDVATVVVPAGTVMSCYVTANSITDVDAVKVNGTPVASGVGVIECDITVNKDIEVILNGLVVKPSPTMPDVPMTYIEITET